ncbi:DUF4389 domain-containing protein [Marinomonas fungiae]|uniref:Lipase n=1 Tax=Marinomonas fungiae TaxID=1137284 RepID=A0A0K6IJI5_9GAMM|nr:DUF4389 domain-containing protein [Marinomonas fungiae]CUB03497.1 Domain of unknown function (DUF4389) [Marinomonas fungiae]
MSKPGYANQEFWIRMLFMLVYWGVLNIALTVFGFLVIIATLVRFASKSEVSLLDQWVSSTGTFIKQTISFLSFTKDEKPFPFQSWPESDGRED